MQVVRRALSDESKPTTVCKCKFYYLFRTKEVSFICTARSYSNKLFVFMNSKTRNLCGRKIAMTDRNENSSVRCATRKIFNLENDDE